MCMCFQQMNWDMNTSKDFTTCHTSIGKCCRKVCLSFSLVCLSGLCWILIFQPNFVSFWIFLNLLVSVNIHVTKAFTWNFADVWHFTSSDPPNILICERAGIGCKSIVKLKFFTQPMHQIYAIKYCILLKLVYQNRNELSGINEWVIISYGLTMKVSKFEKSHCPLKSSVPLPWKPNLIKTLPTEAISRLMIQKRGPVPTYTLLNPWPVS